LAITRLRGFQDTIGADARAVSTVEERARVIAELHNFSEIRIPVLERIELYQRSSGETSDVVEKQMYAFRDGEAVDLVERRTTREAGIEHPAEVETLVALRPEGTPGVVRAYIEAGLDRSDPEQRFYYSGPMFRRERPQKGRFRQFNQFGVEVFGRPDAACDAELLIMIDELRQQLGLELEFQINSLGDSTCRPAFRTALLDWGRQNLHRLCSDCHERLEKNPLRLLDCKIDVEVTESAPTSRDYLCDPCRRHFASVEELLAASGVPYVINPRLVRGLDYYVRTAFEVVSGAVGSQSAVVAGGRYDGLVEALGGAPVAGTGFAIGLERLALALQAGKGKASTSPDVAILALGDAAVAQANSVAAELRAQDVRTDFLSPGRGLKALLRRADKLNARYALIIGGNEIARGVVQVRDLRESVQREVLRTDVVDLLKRETSPTTR
jgi:histidyl-tRNA synthetase